MASPPAAQPRRRKCAATTREALLAAAHRRFLSDSYDNVGLREIAADAGVDVALVGRYFGGKEDLFREVLRGSQDGRLQVDVDKEELPDFLVSLLARGDGEEEPEQRDRLIIMLRSASSATASKIVRDAFRTNVFEPLGEVIGGRDAAGKAALAMALLIGSSFLRTVLALAPAGDEDRARYKDELRRLLRAALSE